MATYTFTAHDVTDSGGNANVVGISTHTIVLSDGGSTICDPGDADALVSIDGGTPHPYTVLGLGTTDGGEHMATIDVKGKQYAFNLDGGQLAKIAPKGEVTDLVDDLIMSGVAPGTLIMTPMGQRPVESLREGDLVTTRDSGSQPVMKVLSRHVSARELAEKSHLRPIRIEAGAAGKNKPREALVVSPQHRFLVDDWRASVLFGEDEVLMTAKSMRDGENIGQVSAPGDVTYLHLVLENHEIIYASGMPTESVPLSDDILNTQPLSVSCALSAIFGDKPAAASIAATSMLSRHEGTLPQHPG